MKESSFGARKDIEQKEKGSLKLKLFPVGEKGRRGLVALLGAGVLSGCMDAKMLPTAASPDILKDQRPSAGDIMHEQQDIKKLAKDVLAKIDAKEKDVSVKISGADIETRSLIFNKDGETKVLVKVTSLIEPTFPSSQISVAVYDRARDFFMISDYSLKDLKGAKNKKGKLENYYLTDAKNTEGNLDVVVSGNGYLPGVVNKFSLEKGKVLDQVYKQENFVSGIMVRACEVKDPGAFSKELSSPSLVDDKTTQFFTMYHLESGLTPTLQEPHLDNSSPMKLEPIKK